MTEYIVTTAIIMRIVGLPLLNDNSFDIVDMRSVQKSDWITNRLKQMMCFDESETDSQLPQFGSQMNYWTFMDKEFITGVYMV